MLLLPGPERSSSAWGCGSPEGGDQSDDPAAPSLPPDPPSAPARTTKGSQTGKIIR